MIARKTNSQTMPDYCIQRHRCLRRSVRYMDCPTRCSRWDFVPRTGDVYARLDAEKAESK